MLALVTGACTVENPVFEVAPPADASGTTRPDEPTGTAAGSSGSSGDTGTPTTAAMTTTTGEVTATTGTSTGHETTGSSTGSIMGDTSSTTTGESGSESGMIEPDMGAPVGCGDGDGDPRNKELCDDGNDIKADGCEANCRPMFLVEYVPIKPNPRDLAAADLDDDGQVDLAIVHATADPNSVDITVLSNLKDVITLKEIVDGGITNCNQILVGQFIGGPLPDLLLMSSSQATMRLYENTSVPGKVTFAAAKAVAGPTAGPDAVTADMDGNKFDDVLVLSNGKLHMYLVMPVGLAAGLLVKNSMLPHVAVVHTSAMNDLTLVIGGGGMLNDLEPTHEVCAGGAIAVAAGDADRAGPIDLAIACSSGSLVLRGEDAVKAYTRSFGGDLPPLIGAGILDIYGDDDDADVFAVSATASTVYVGVQEAKQFLAPHEITLQGVPGRAVVEDLRGDEAQDIAVLFPGDQKVALVVNQTQVPKPE